MKVTKLDQLSLVIFQHEENTDCLNKCKACNNKSNRHTCALKELQFMFPTSAK